MSNTPQGQEQSLEQAQGFTIQTFLASLIVSFATFGVEVAVFLVIKQKLPRIYHPRTYLVPERERTNAPPPGLWSWTLSVFSTSNTDFIQKCGLDAYFFLRYLRMLLKIFIPLAFVILPILVPLNAVGGRNTDYFHEAPYSRAPGNWNNSVVGLNQLSWGNVRPSNSGRYWVHLLLAVFVVVYCLFTFYDELRSYIRLRQAYLTSPQHRIRASATTVLVSAIPRKWCTVEALEGLYDVFPGGIRNIWVNRNFDALSDKVNERNQIALKLESAQTDLIKKAKKNHMEELKKEAKKTGQKQSREERAALQRQQDEDAVRLAESGAVHEDGQLEEKKSPLPTSLAGVGQGVGKIGKTILGGLRTVGNGINNELMTTQGFQLPPVDDPEPRPVVAATTPQEGPASLDSIYDSRRVDGHVNGKRTTTNAPKPPRAKPVKIVTMSEVGQKHVFALPSPVPNGHEENGSQWEADSEGMKSLLDKFQVWKKGKDVEKQEEYPQAYNNEYDSIQDGEPLWKKYVKDNDRKTSRLPVFGIKWLGWIPFGGKKVDTIDHCRKELARLNLEIEVDQEEPQKYPLMNSAFIQFNHQVAAHMACQSVSHHVPSLMAPRVVEISPGDVVWDNLSVQWWERYIRVGVVVAAVVGLILAWTFPVAFTGLLANIKYLSASYSWLAWLGRIPYQIISPIQGVLPQVLLAILLAVLPIILRLLARLQGLPTGMSIELRMADFYFCFLFVQVFFVVTIAAGATNVFSVTGQLGSNPSTIPSMLATSIPPASNYYFSYMILQALGTSGGTLLQIGSLVVWFLLAPILDSTARAKWKRQITLSTMQWGEFFPVYSNLACIGLIYSVVSPIILIFNCVTFSLFWFVFRYNTLYVTKFQFDTGGLLFPKAINHTFVGVYVMEICLVGLFFLETGVNNDGSPRYGVCVPQGIIMIVVLTSTVLFHFMLNYTFGPLIRYLPITLEDDAVARDEEFARAQHKRFNYGDEEQESDDIDELAESRVERNRAGDNAGEAIELNKISSRRNYHRLDPRSLTHSSGERIKAIAPSAMTGWADRSRRRRSAWLDDSQGAKDGNAQSDNVIRDHRLRHLENVEHGNPRPMDFKDRSNNHTSSTIGDVLFAGINDEIEDLSPEERDILVQRAFQHAALRARRPIIWIPRDDLGVSDDEVRRTRKFSEHIWINNEHTGLDSKARVVYRKSPPDFSELDLIEL